MKSIRFNKLWFYVIGISLGILAITTALRAATFNTFFNNVEQGANSTSNPTLHISDGKALKTTSTPPPSTPSAPDTPTTETPTPPSTATSVAQLQTTNQPTESAHKRYFRFGLLGHTLSQDRALLGPQASNNNWGGTLSAAFFPLRDLGLNLFVSASPGAPIFFGGDVEITPLRLNIFDLPNFIEGGLLVGASSLGRESNLWGTAHIGARLGINFGERYGITAGVRTNLTDRKQFDYVMGDAGFVVHL